MTHQWLIMNQSTVTWLFYDSLIFNSYQYGTENTAKSYFSTTTLFHMLLQAQWLSKMCLNSFIWYSTILFEVMGEQIDNKRGMNTSREACSSITSTGNSVFCGILVGSLNTDIGFELLATAMERKDMAANQCSQLALIQISKFGFLQDFYLVRTITRQWWCNRSCLVNLCIVFVVLTFSSLLEVEKYDSSNI